MYLPSPKIIVTSKASPKLRAGVFVGYRLKSGARWTGEYLVFDLDSFVGSNLGVDANANWGHMVPHITKHIEVTMPDFFPLSTL